MIFIPCGGLAGVKAVLPLLVGKNNFLPAFVVGGDHAHLITELTEGLGVFARHSNRAISVGEESGRCLEDLVPTRVYVDVFERYLEDNEFSSRDIDYNRASGIVGSIELMIEERNYALPSDWRVEVAQRVKQEMVKTGAKLYASENDKWQLVRTLFAELVKL